MPVKESQRRAASKYQKSHTTTFGFMLNNEKDKDIIDWLRKQPSKAQYFRDIVRADIARNAQNWQEGGSASSNE